MKSILFSVLFTFLITANSYASLPFWGPTGHRAMGKIAEEHLSRKVLKKIDKLLDGKSLAFVSTYGDDIKSDRKYDKFYTWHYINMPFDQTYEESEKNPDGDLVTGINKCITVLKDKKSSREDQQFYLKLLVHLIGDLHQPLHIGRKSDKGGNTIQVQWFGKGTNLHRVWDEDMIDKFGMSYLELAENAEDLSKKQIEAIKKGSVVDWVNEIHKLTIEVYNSVEVGQNLRYKYNYLYFDTVRTQLQKAGIRLAKILNDIYG
ncbi:MAG: S1/P1 Nuclease [Flavobacteriales bacterium]|nr:MAG: S1/P1 Nuclease [Flavobacteriales bacterium]